MAFHSLESGSMAVIVDLQTRRSALVLYDADLRPVRARLIGAAFGVLGTASRWRELLSFSRESRPQVSLYRWSWSSEQQ
jgi:hypothetical protein